MQDDLKEHRLNISELVNKQRAHIYVCGDVRMAEDVKNQLDEILRQAENDNQIINITKNFGSESDENHQNGYMKPAYKCATDLLKVRNALDNCGYLDARYSFYMSVFHFSNNTG